MNDLPATLAAHRQEIDIFTDVAKALDPGRWAAPRPSGGWSPAQITEHLSRVFEFGSSVIEGRVSGRQLPWLLRWLISKMWVRPVIRNGRFTGKTRAPKSFQPREEHASPEELLPRLRTASAHFAALVDQQVGAGVKSVDHPIFGRVALLDFLRLQVIHVRHHRAQLSPPSS